MNEWMNEWVTCHLGLAGMLEDVGSWQVVPTETTEKPAAGWTTRDSLLSSSATSSGPEGKTEVIMLVHSSNNTHIVSILQKDVYVWRGNTRTQRTQSTTWRGDTDTRCWIISYRDTRWTMWRWSNQMIDKNQLHATWINYQLVSFQANSSNIVTF